MLLVLNMIIFVFKNITKRVYFECISQTIVMLFLSIKKKLINGKKIHDIIANKMNENGNKFCLGFVEEHKNCLSFTPLVEKHLFGS